MRIASILSWSFLKTPMISSSSKHRKWLYMEEKLQDRQCILLHPFWYTLPSSLCGILWSSIFSYVMEESGLSTGTHVLSLCAVNQIEMWTHRYRWLYILSSPFNTHTHRPTHRKREISGYKHHMALFTDQGLLTKELNMYQMLALVQLCVQTHDVSSTS